MPPPTQAFEVDLDYGKSYRFVWRQADGMRPWDVLRGDDKGVAGVFSVESEFNAAGEAQRLVECLWTDTKTPGRYSAGCSSDRSVDPSMRALVDALRLNVDASFVGPEIQGNATRCFEIADEGVGGEVCVVATTGEPVRIFIVSTEHPEFNLSLEAEHSPTHELSLPQPLQPDLQGSFSADVLGLPDPLGVPR